VEPDLPAPSPGDSHGPQDAATPSPDPASQPGASGPQDASPWSPPRAPPVTPMPSYGEPVAPAPVEMDKVSVTAFVLSLFGVGMAAIPLGIWGVVRTGRGSRRGRGFAIGALVVSALWAVVAAITVVALVGSEVTEQSANLAGPAATTSAVPSATDGPTAEPSVPVEEVESVYWQDVEPGMCIVDPEVPDDFDVQVVDCSAGHHTEVIARTSLPGTKTHPGDAAVDRVAMATCVREFDRYVGVAWDTSRLSVDYITTVLEDWERGDRTVVCLLFDPEADLMTRSFKGSRE